MGLLKNAAIAGVGVWAGTYAAGFVQGVLPKKADGSPNVMLGNLIGYGVTGLAVIYALKLLGHRKG